VHKGQVLLALWNDDVEAEKRRTEGAAAKQRIAQLERQLRSRGGREPRP